MTDVESHKLDPVAEFVRVWTDPGWWLYLLRDCRGPRHFICRVRNHPAGVVWHNPGGIEPDMHCRNCGEDLW